MEGLEVYVRAPEPPKPPAKPKPSSIPGLAAAVTVAALAWLIHQFYKPVSPAIVAILLGAAIRNTVKIPQVWIDGCKGVVRRVIPVTIVLTGASLNLAEVARAGLPSLA